MDPNTESIRLIIKDVRETCSVVKVTTMFVDDGARGWGEPETPHCKGCKQPIGSGNQFVIVEFPADTEHRLEEMNGIYHASCAKPLLSVARALSALCRPFPS